MPCDILVHLAKEKKIGDELIQAFLGQGARPRLGFIQNCGCSRTIR
ncbi:MAG: hypothetical protein H0U75_00305 [Legionella sp.]|nr:hypothetical protein [Legionella sp.]